MAGKNNFPKLHNAMWPGLVGKGPDSEPPIDLDTMIALTAKAEVNGVKFDGIDIFHAAPHTNIDFTADEAKALADKAARHNLAIGSIVAPVWPPVGGGSAMGSAEDRAKFVANVRKSCELGKALRDLGVRKYGVIRIDSASSPADWAKDPVASTKLIAQPPRSQLHHLPDGAVVLYKRERSSILQMRLSCMTMCGTEPPPDIGTWATPVARLERSMTEPDSKKNWASRKPPAALALPQRSAWCNWRRRLSKACAP